MTERDKAYLLKELTRTIDESDSTAAFCLCQRWILKDALSILKEQPEIVKCGDCKFAEKQVCRQKEYECQCTLSEFEGLYDFHSRDWFCADGKRRE